VVAGGLALPRRSGLMLALFRAYTRRYLARHFHAVRLSRRGPVPVAAGGPLVVVLNHPSWWDPLVCLWLSGLLPGREHYAPMDAAALGRYRFFGRLGFFAVERGTLRGAAAFLRTGLAVGGRPQAVLWVTAQGRFADPRTPAALEPGIGHLARRLEGGHLVPLALEYPFWHERLPEALIRFGTPIPLGTGGHLSAAEWTAYLGQQLTVTQEHLAAEACGQDGRDFETLIQGRVGVGGVYDLWRRVRARLRGERFRPEHAPGEGESQPRRRNRRGRGA
jgi:1-acyl-sn-glycerol-3-phosphate acyltransferase